MKRLVLCAASFALLAGCSSEAVSLQPGQWESTGQFTSIEWPGMAPGDIADIRQQMGQPQRELRCLTAEDVADPAHRMIHMRASNCHSTESTFANGIIRVHNICQSEDGQVQHWNVDGTFTATTVQARMSNDVSRPGEPALSMSGPMASHRIGDCPRP